MKNLKGDYKGAITDINKAIELHPKYFNAYISRGFIHYNLKQHQKAHQDFVRFLKLAPGHPMAPQIRRYIVFLSIKINQVKNKW